MTIARSTALTDPGRRRRQNEDAFVCEPPLFAVADGMGGAQAGELASRLAAASVERSDTAGLTGRERVISLIEEANRSVFERANEDEAVSGMGTTMTVALVEADEVWIGHVGDSRAYLIRNEKLEQLTEDHSLVAELVRSGRITPEEAESHPHRSVITRALGTEEDIDVDAFSVPTRPGDLFMLCSDGLTAMVEDSRILELVEEHRPDLAAAARALVEEANRQGGEDNVTVVLFDLAAIDDTVELEGVLGDAPAVDEDTLDGLEAVPVVGAAPPAPAEAPAPRRRHTARWVAAAGIVIAALVGTGLFGLSRAHFVGAESNGHIAVYQGLPWNLGLGLRLYRVVYESPLLAAELSQDERKRLFDHDLRSYSSALGAVRVHEREVAP